MGTVLQEPLGVLPVFVRSTWTQIVLAVARTTSKYRLSFARRMVPTGMTGVVGVVAGIVLSSCYWCCLLWIVVLVYHVSAPRVYMCRDVVLRCVALAARGGAPAFASSIETVARGYA